MEDVASIKSTNSLANSFVIFLNETDRIVDVIWVGYQSECFKYRTLNPTDRFAVNTFKTHPWLFRDNKTGERMNVENKYVFWPREFNPDTRPRRRDVIRIHFPMRSLMENTLWKIVECLNQEEQLEEIQIPAFLKEQLKSRLRIKNEYKTRS